MQWTVLIPMRALPHAKSRLAATLPPGLHADVVEAIRADTVAAVHASAPVARVLVVGDVAGPTVDVVQQSAGLNGALRDGSAVARSRWPHDGVAALVGDLPALRPEELSAALTAAAAQSAGFVRDSDGTGTTLLTAGPASVLDPRFGAGSAARHGGIAVEIPAGPGLRQDVDTADDLSVAIRLGVGPATTAVIGLRTVLPGSP